MNTTSSLSLIRHAESDYGRLSRLKKSIPGYQELSELMDVAVADQGQLERDILAGNWPTPDIRSIASAVYKQMQCVLDCSDAETSITDDGFTAARERGLELAGILETPDVIYVSPYLRTRQTLEGLRETWSELRDVPTVETPLIREQDHGLSGELKDWRILFAQYPYEAIRFPREGKYEYRHLQGENVPDLRQRVRVFVDDVLHMHDGERVLAVTHDRTILAVRSILEDWSPDEHVKRMRTDQPKELSLTYFELTGDHFERVDREELVSA